MISFNYYQVAHYFSVSKFRYIVTGTESQLVIAGFHLSVNIKLNLPLHLLIKDLLW